MMKRYKVVIAYDGARYLGWQSQKQNNSIQEEVEGALHRVAHKKILAIAAGRTDAGVNAWGQVFHFDSDIGLTARKWMGALNGQLPKDIRIRSVEEVNRRFHARYCVKRKQYDYSINLGEYDVFTRDYAFQCPFPLDIPKMKEASRYLVGTHDFASFNANSFKETPNQVRNIESITFTKQKNLYTISFVGKGFLRYMVRMMSAALIDVGRGRLSPIDVKKMLEEKSKSLSPRRCAPSQGLTLRRIDYFLLVAESEEGIIREFLPMDTCPKTVTKAQIRAKQPKVFLFCPRHTQDQWGVLKLSKRKGLIDASLNVYLKQHLSIAQSLLPQVEETLKTLGKVAKVTILLNGKTSPKVQ